MTTVLVTGAAGFLGRAFVREHLKRGDRVLGVDDLSSFHAYWPDELPEPYRHTIDIRSWFRKYQDNDYRWDLAYHFAAPVGGRAKIEGDPLFNADSLGIDAAFFRWAIDHIGIAVLPSSSAVYGAALQEGNGTLLEESFFHADAIVWDAPDELYGLTKLVGEILAWKSEKYGLNTLCIRPFSGYGPGQSLEYPVPSILTRAKRREDPLVVWGTGEQKRDFVYIDDVVGATLARLAAGVHGYQTMNIASGRAISFHQVAQMAAGLVGYEPEIKELTDKPSGVSSRFGSPARMQQFYKLRVPLAEGLLRTLGTL